MKKIMSSVLIIALLMGCFFSSFTVSSETADISGSNIRAWIKLLEENMPNDKDKRSTLFNYLKAYMIVDEGIDTIIGIIKNDDFGSHSTLEQVFDAFGDDIRQYDKEMIFALNFFKSIPEQTRENYINAFSSRTATNLGSEASKLQWLYDNLVSAEGQSKLAAHGVDKDVIFHLFKSLDGHIVITDTSDGSGFALKSLSDTFRDNLANNLEEFSSVNGKSFSTPDKMIELILNSINNDNTYTDTFVKYTKVVLGKINLYKPLDTDTPRPTARPTARPGGGTTVVVGSSSPTPTQLPPTPTPVNNIPEPKDIEAEYFFPDTANHWGGNYIGSMNRRGIFVGYENGNFEPDWGITRQEMAVVMVRALGLEDRLAEAVGQDFADGGSIAAWAEASVRLMVDMGIYTGYDDGEFKPDRTITREELVALIVRIVNSGTMHDRLYYVDSDNVGDWAKNYVNEATALGIIGGYADGSFQPKNAVTRAEAAKIIYNFMSIQGLL